MQARDSTNLSWCFRRGQAKASESANEKLQTISERRENRLMDESSKERLWPALAKDDDGLQDEIMALLSTRAVGNPYSEDGKFAASIASFPPGLRAMAATHWLYLRLTMDSTPGH